MSKVRLRAGYGPRDVPLLDRQVEDGETVEVPDYQPGHVDNPGEPDHNPLPIVWPDPPWEPVAEPKIAPEKAAKATAADKAASS